jgi:signal peptidase II
MSRFLPAPILKVTLGLAVLVIGLDQLSKWLILTQVMRPPRIIEVTGFFNLKLTFNQGISFGLFSGESVWQPYVLSLVAVMISVGLVFWLRQEPRRLFALAVGLIIGGALGNVVDRLYLGAVVDFLDLHLGAWHWPAFNLADSAITVGVVLILYDSLFTGGAGSTNDQSKGG